MKISIAFPIVHRVDDYHQFTDIVDVYKAHTLDVQYYELGFNPKHRQYEAIFYLPGQKINT